MKTILTFFFAFFSIAILAQSAGDTIMVQSFDYSQTHSPNGRDTMIDFPDDPGQSYEKILMFYNMRCKDGLVSNQSNTNQGCGEWDYSCNTYITDSTRVDSVISYTASHAITAFSDTLFTYVDYPLYDYYQYNQQEVIINSINSENIYTVGTGNLLLPFVLSTSENSAKSQFLFTEAELAAAGVQGGEIDAIELEVLSGTATAQYLRVKIKHTSKTSLDNADPDTSDFTEVYFYDQPFTAGTNRIQFHSPFIWDGSSNIIVEFSFTNNTPDDALVVEGESTASTMGIAATNSYSLNNIFGLINIPADPLDVISEEITVSFWTYGNEDILPTHTMVIWGTDSANQRSLNVHHPWGNGTIYFDCGNVGNSYDRIDKGASPEEYSGSWCNWTFTKNATTGLMAIYRNGVLWHSGTDKTRLIDIQSLVFGSNEDKSRVWSGKLDELSIWDKELTQQTIQDWLMKPIDPSHPEYANLLAYYKLDEGSGTTVNDASTQAQITSIDGNMYWKYERGNTINRGFSEVSERPNVAFVQGDYNMTVNGMIITDSLLIDPNIVREYSIVPNWGTMKHDSIAEVSVTELWQVQYQYTYDPDGIAIDSIMPSPTGTISITELTYYQRYPSKYQIMSFVTPYGIYLDLGMNGKTWVFDVTDYAPILKGAKRMTMERGGQRQEDMDIKFAFIIGTPTRDILDNNPIWRNNSHSYTSIQSGRVFENRNVTMRPDGDSFKVKSVITGHGQQGEFSPRHHTLNIDGGNIEYDWVVWTECSTIPIYPQGGTWIYDRAGWCPGDPSDIHEFDISEYVSPGTTHSFDYNVTYASGTSNYLISEQLVTYGEPNFGLDAALVRVLKPNRQDASQERFNPACTYPEIVIKNNGTTPINSLEIVYSVVGGNAETYSWSGSLEFLEMDTVILPIPELTFWLSGGNQFTVSIGNVNGQVDEYIYNNIAKSHFDNIDLYPESELIDIELKTNNTGYQSSFILYDGDGNIVFERDDCESNTIYNDELLLDPGCYSLRINDTGGNGLDFWHQPNQGTGYFRIKDGNGAVLYTFDPDFGGFAIYEFGVGNIVKIDQLENQFALNVYPNPTSGKLNVKVKGSGNAKVSLSLINSLMVTVLEEEWTVDGRDFNTSIDMQHLPSGIYFLHFNYGGNSKVKKVIKL